MADAYGLMPGHIVQQSDAEQAYTQAWFRGEDTWVRLPKDQWPQEWHDKGYVDPVCPLVLALYGHPDSGSDWEAHADKCVRSVGYAPVPNWPSCYWHEEKQLVVVIYVDDFKLAGPMGNLEEGWQLLRS